MVKATHIDDGATDRARVIREQERHCVGQIGAVDRTPGHTAHNLALGEGLHIATEATHAHAGDDATATRNGDIDADVVMKVVILSS